MAIDVHWHNPTHDIIYTSYGKKWTWDDFYLVAQRTKQLIDTESHAPIVDVIADMTSDVLPYGGSQLHGISILKDKHPNVGVIVLVTKNGFISTLAQMSFKASALMREHYRIVGSVAEAEQLIAEIRQQRQQNV